ncbi:MAG TPA: diaminobutyrate--2-oxoglutarate transaminase [Candidatus Faecimorpha stercoravium]|nr:diaminobutyrate--2-oxoglutarate transaminase [Candidatus Faecimorpha stercoravium]
MAVEVFETYESEVRSYCRKFTAVFATAKGSKIWDEEGREYLDFFDGAGALNYGHNNDYIKEKLIDYLQKDGISHALDMYTGPKRDFIEYFEDNILKPRNLDYKLMFTGPTGTNAIEAALKLARKVTKRTNIFALMGCFHGMTMGALALTTDMASRAGAGVPLHDVTHIPAPYMFPELDTVAYMEQLLADDHSGVEKPAALVLETIQAEGGIFPFDFEWLKRIEDFCHRHEILLIIDDIQVGCGRSGAFFSFEKAGIHPDMVALSKSIGGYGLPMALLLFKPELDIWKPGEHNGTFRGNQMAFIAAKAALEFALSTNLYESVNDKSKIVEEYMKNEILPLDERLAVRGRGLIFGLDFSKAAPKGTCREVVTECFKNGLIIEQAGRDDSVLKLMPALTISEEELVQGLEIIKKSAQAVLARKNG